MESALRRSSALGASCLSSLLTTALSSTSMRSASSFPSSASFPAAKPRSPFPSSNPPPSGPSLAAFPLLPRQPARPMTSGGLVGGDGLSRRFYKNASIRPCPEGNGFEILLDQRVLKTPARRHLVLPTRALALAIAAEWEYQSERHIRPFTMPLMSLAATALDRTPDTRPSVIQHLLRHLPTDSAVHRDEPGDLEKKQREVYDPMVGFVNQKLGLRLKTGDSIFGVKHPKGTADSVGKFLQSLDDWHLTCVDELARSCRSMVVALNLYYGKLGYEEAVWKARVEEEFQIDLWGMVEGGHDIDRADLRVRISSACLLLKLLGHR